MDGLSLLARTLFVMIINAFLCFKILLFSLPELASL